MRTTRSRIAGGFPSSGFDLAAGTGAHRQLVAHGAEVVAVERAMRCEPPESGSCRGGAAGSAEAIPLPDGSVDAVTVGQAFHWFRTGEALAELHRVLRPGGGFALLWNEWDDDDPLLHELNGLVDALRPEGTHEARATWQATLHASPLFVAFDERTFRHSERLDADTIVDRVASVSAIAAAAPEEQARVEARVRALVGEGEVDFPLITSVIVSDRV
jgi:SAM-dependent methyltransferase